MKNLIKHTGYGLSGELFIRIIKFFQVLLIIKILGSDQYGDYIKILSTASLLSVFFDAGLSEIALKECIKNEYNFFICLKYKLFISILGSIIFCIWIIYNIKINYIIMYAFCISNWISDTAYFTTFRFKARNEYKKDFKYRVYNYILQFVLITTLILIYKNIYAISIGLIISSLISLYISYTKNDYKNILNNYQLTTYYNIFKDTIPFLISLILSAIFTNYDIIVLGQYVNNNVIGQYSLILKLASGILIMPSVYLYRTLLSDYKYNNDISDLKKWARTTEPIFIYASYCALLTLYISPILIKLILNVKYDLGVFTLYILSLCSFFTIITFPLVQFLYLSNLRKKLIISTFFSCMIFLTLLHILIPKYNTIGAALSILITSLLNFIYQFFIIAKKYSLIEYDLIIKLITLLINIVFCFIIYIIIYINKYNLYYLYIFPILIYNILIYKYIINYANLVQSKFRKYVNFRF